LSEHVVNDMSLQIEACQSAMGLCLLAASSAEYETHRSLFF